MRIDGGIVAYNEARKVALAIRSLLDQQLPPGFTWGTLWVVASGCTDRTAELARATDPRVRVIEEAERRGKSAALAEIFRQTQAGFLVLVNADAIAKPGAVERLLDGASRLQRPFAVSGRPVLPDGFSNRGFAASVRLLWEIHHEYQLASSESGTLTNLTDELLLLSSPALPPLREGIVNDGGFIAAWIRRQGGDARYIPEALVEIEAPAQLAPYVRQRRRIRWGARQVRSLTGVSPGSVQRQALHQPGRSCRALRRATGRATTGRVLPLAGLVGAELMALALAEWDRVPPRRDHTLWVTLPE